MLSKSLWTSGPTDQLDLIDMSKSEGPVFPSKLGKESAAVLRSHCDLVITVLEDEQPKHHNLCTYSWRDRRATSISMQSMQIEKKQ